MTKPLAVLISDIHYSIPTLELADAAMRQAIAKANDLNVPLIVAGDLHDTKANLRGECINAMLSTFSEHATEVFILIGNHDKINEKSENHALNFLKKQGEFVEDYDRNTQYPSITIVDQPEFTNEFSLNANSPWFIPYQHDPEEFKHILTKIDKDSLIIMHQGISGSLPGEYTHDKTAIPKEWLTDYRVISGHYHTRQDIKCGRPRAGTVGLASYLGNPYTLNFGEASDPEKGFNILMSNGNLEFVPTNLRKHIVIEMIPNQRVTLPPHIALNDIIKIKYTGTREECSKVNKESIKQELRLMNDFRLELIHLDNTTEIKQETKTYTQSETLDNLIDSMKNTSAEQKIRLKSLWKSL